ncbi:unnamed protein product, partial [Didymodactylos carnosus]
MRAQSNRSRETVSDVDKNKEKRQRLKKILKPIRKCGPFIINPCCCLTALLLTSLALILLGGLTGLIVYLTHKDSKIITTTTTTTTTTATVCNPTCLHNGNCTSPNTCVCYIGGFGNKWQGSYCQDPIPSIITQITDTYYAICKTTAGGDSIASTPGLGICQYTSGVRDENPLNAVDEDVTTKYVNFGWGNISTSSATQGVGTGFYVTPLNGVSVLKGILFATANDAEERDPLMCTIEGSNYTTSLLSNGYTWTLLYS